MKLITTGKTGGYSSFGTFSSKSFNKQNKIEK